MNTITKTITAMLTIFMMATPALADHGGGYSGLREATFELNSVVQWSSLRWKVKDAVSRFTNAVEAYAYCDGNDDGDYDNDEPNSFNALEPMNRSEFTTMDHNDRNNCFRLKQYLRATWRPVSRYLYDTNWDYPEVYHAYLETQEALSYIL